ncbi:hypothetical protein DFH27DRAFT_530576 [Peziza echinospora]|nr:hypothetical protein DFH27DRAFT_530576 [Peziza echinospora]
MAHLHTESPAAEDPSSSPHAAPLIDRCNALLEEIRTLQEFAKEEFQTIELRTFRGNVQSELRFLKNIGSTPTTISDAAEDDQTQHFLRSSNLRYFELVWAAAKASPGLVSLLTQIPETGLCPFIKQDKPVKTVQIEIVAEDGLHWVKLSAISPKRLMYELAKAGWEGSAEDSDEEEGEAGEADWNRTVVSAIPLVQHADLLAGAAQCTWVRYKHPRITYLFHNVNRETCGRPIELIFKRIEETGAVVQCADDPDMLLTSQPPTIQDTMDRIKSRDTFSNFSEKLNIDCTILLALASEISCRTVDPSSRRFNRAILSQLNTETSRPLLTSTLFPALINHELYCTKTARQRFVEIILEIGTADEKTRAEAILGVRIGGGTGENDTPIPQNELNGIFQELCIHPVPAELRLPIRVYDEECFDGPKAWLPYVKRVADKLSLINQSVFLTGWELKHTTVTSNMVTGKVIESEWTSILDGLRRDGTLEKLLEDGESTLGPDLYVVEMARSLVGKGPKGKLEENETISIESVGAAVEEL